MASRHGARWIATLCMCVVLGFFHAEAKAEPDDKVAATLARARETYENSMRSLRVDVE